MLPVTENVSRTKLGSPGRSGIMVHHVSGSGVTD